MVRSRRGAVPPMQGGQHMGPARQLADKWWKAFIAGQLDQMTALVADDIELRGPGVELRGKAQLMPYLQVFKEAFPDLRAEVLASVEQNGHAFIELRIEATHTGPMKTPDGTIPPTGKRVVWHATDEVRISNGKITTWN